MSITLNFGGDPDHRALAGIVLRIRHYWEWLTNINLDPSRTDSPDGGNDIATLVRCGLAEVCTVPALLVSSVHLCRQRRTSSDAAVAYRVFLVRHSNLWSHCGHYVVGQHGVLRVVKW